MPVASELVLVVDDAVLLFLPWCFVSVVVVLWVFDCSGACAKRVAAARIHAKASFFIRYVSGWMASANTLIASELP